MKKKIISISLLALGICSMAMATEYKDPDVGFKKRVAPSKEMKASDFGDHYRVETGMGNDRQIASEESERDPSSMVGKAKKAPAPIVEDHEAPKPWLYRAEAEKK